MSNSPFAAVESALLNPKATGIMIVHLEDGSALAASGIQVGEVLTHVGGDEVRTLTELVQTVRPIAPGAGVELTIVGSDGETRTVGVVAPIGGVEGAAVREGEAAWADADDAPEAPDITSLLEGSDEWFRTWLGDDLAGYERFRVFREGDDLVALTDFHIAGEHEGQAWDYRTRARTHHAPDESLALRYSRFEEGNGDHLMLRGEARLGDDGQWHGQRGGPDGVLREETHAAEVAPMVTPYSAILLPQTMPRRKGAVLTFPLAGEGRARVTRRARFECLGEQAVMVDGQATGVWTYAWRHYGHSAGEERFHVDADGRLVRIDWGPTYGNCWAERVERDALDAIPAAPKASMNTL